MYRIVFSVIVIFWLAFPISYQIRNMIRGNLFLRFVRIIGMNIPYFAIFLILPVPFYHFRWNLTALYVSIILAIIYTLLDVSNIKNSLKVELFPFLNKVEGKNLVSRFGEVTIVPLMEEFFFRGTIPIDGTLLEIVFTFCISTLIFCLAHYVEMSRELVYHLKLIVLSLASMGMYYFTKNILYAVFFHMLCNLPWLFINLKMYWYGKKAMRKN